MVAGFETLRTMGTVFVVETPSKPWIINRLSLFANTAKHEIFRMNQGSIYRNFRPTRMFTSAWINRRRLDIMLGPNEGFQVQCVAVIIRWCI